MWDNIIGPKRSLEWVYDFWPVFVFSLAAGLAATALCKKIALKLHIVDKPNDTVKTHEKPIAYLGGLGILAGLFVGVMTGLYLLQGEPYFAKVFKWLLAILAGATIACVVGVVDDIIEIKPLQKILGQLLAAFALIAAGILPQLHHFTQPLGLEMPAILETVLGIFVVIFFVLGATNSLNLLDGLDGLCAGVTAIITIAMLLIAIHLSTWDFSKTGDPTRIIICLSLVGAVLGFLPFNRHPAKIFMGDAGSMLLGFCIAALMLLFAEKIPRWWMASIIVFGLPILDTATALARRLLNKRPLFQPDRGHIYDQMIDRGIPLKKTVAISYGLAGLYALTGIIISQIRTRYALIVYIAVFVISAVAVWKKGYLKMEGLRGKTKTHHTKPNKTTS